MPFEPVAEIRVKAGAAAVYAEGWQSWSPVGIYSPGDPSPRPPDELRRTMGWRPGRPEPTSGIQAEGILALELPTEGGRAWFAPNPAREVASIRLEEAGGRLVVSADADVGEIRAGGLDKVLAAIGDRLGRATTSAIGRGWCSWPAYFSDVTEDDVVENLTAADRLGLPIEIVQVDDGYAAGIGDWLDTMPTFGSLKRLADRITSAGLAAGVWTAPFLVGERSGVANAHPDWLVKGADAGWHWNQRLRVLDVTHPDAAEYLGTVFRTLAEWGFTYHKLDFLYAGAIDGARHADCSSLEAYRHGLRLIRNATGRAAVLVGCGAPLLPSIGLVDAMRIGPDVLSESPGATPDLAHVARGTQLRQWMNDRLWVNDPDCLVVRPGIAEREAWASHLDRYFGLRFSGDRLESLDERGVELTRRVLGA